MPDAFNSLPNWWEGREFEHKAEVQALSVLLSRIYKRKSILDIGAGFGRLTPIYAPFFSKIVLVDRSTRLLSFAENYVGEVRGAEFIKGEAEELPVQSDFFDVALCVHTTEEITNLRLAMSEINRALQTDGYLILETPSRHLGNTLIDLKNSGFEILEVLSVNNIRPHSLKKFLPASLLLMLEAKLQTMFSRRPVGQSAFILAQKNNNSENSKEAIFKPLSFRT